MPHFKASSFTTTLPLTFGQLSFIITQLAQTNVASTPGITAALFIQATLSRDHASDPPPPSDLKWLYGFVSDLLHSLLDSECADNNSPMTEQLDQSLFDNLKCLIFVLAITPHLQKEDVFSLSPADK